MKRNVEGQLSINNCRFLICKRKRDVLAGQFSHSASWKLYLGVENVLAEWLGVNSIRLVQWGIHGP